MLDETQTHARDGDTKGVRCVLPISTAKGPLLSLTVFTRHPYSDVTLLASADPHANAWRLKVEDDQVPKWLPVEAMIMDSHLNWSTPDLTLWDVLRLGEPGTIHTVFPDAGRGIPASAPFAVMWDVSAWTNTRPGDAFRFRFTDPAGIVFDLPYQSLLRKKHVIG